MNLKGNKVKDSVLKTGVFNKNNLNDLTNLRVKLFENLDSDFNELIDFIEGRTSSMFTYVYSSYKDSGCDFCVKLNNFYLNIFEM